MGEEAKMHQYPDQEERSDPLRVDKELLHPDSQLTGRLLALVQVVCSNISRYFNHKYEDRYLWGGVAMF